MSDHIPDVTKMIGETPRTDGEYWYDGDYVPSGFARQLERELNVANERIKNLESALGTVENIDKVNAYQDLESANERIKRLEEALTWYESTVSDCNRHGPKGDVARDALAKDQGRKAKEAKP